MSVPEPPSVWVPLSGSVGAGGAVTEQPTRVSEAASRRAAGANLEVMGSTLEKNSRSVPERPGS
jgi:hypothetical protein